MSADRWTRPDVLQGDLDDLAKRLAEAAGANGKAKLNGHLISNLADPWHPVVKAMLDAGLLIQPSVRQPRAWVIECPLAQEHTDPDADAPDNEKTLVYEVGGVVCLHANHGGHGTWTWPNHMDWAKTQSWWKPELASLASAHVARHNFGELPRDPQAGDPQGFLDPPSKRSNPFEDFVEPEVEFQPLTQGVPVVRRPARPWIVPSWLMRGHVTQVFAEPAAGKSSLAVLLMVALDMAQPGLMGHGQGDWRRGGGCLVIANEDDHDEWLLRRDAVLQYHKLDVASFVHSSAMVVKRGRPVKLYERKERGGAILRNDAAFRDLKARVEVYRPQVLICDTQVSITTGLGENDAADMDFVASDMRAWAKQQGLAVLLLHHTVKSAWSGKQRKGPSMADARGSGAMGGAIRVGWGMWVLSEEEEKHLPAIEHGCWVKVRREKGTHMKRGTAGTVWFFWETVRLSVDDETLPGQMAFEDVGILVYRPTGPVGAFGVDVPGNLEEVLDLVDAGVFIEDSSKVLKRHSWVQGVRSKSQSLILGLAQALGCAEDTAKTLVENAGSKKLIETYPGSTASKNAAQLYRNTAEGEKLLKKWREQKKKEREQTGF